MKEIDPKQTSRAEAFSLWMKAPLPMVTLFVTLDVTNLVKISRKTRRKFNMLLCWCIGQAASKMPEFYLLPVGGKLMQFERLAVSTVVAEENGGIAPCDIPFSSSLSDFERDYLSLTRQAQKTCQTHDLSKDFMVIGTSALVRCRLNGAVNLYTDLYNNPFMIWGRYEKKRFKAALPLSFQFHHTQMDGGHAARFLETLQQEIRALRT